MAIITSVLDKFTIIIAFQYCRKYAINGYYNFYCVFHHCRLPLRANPISILSTHVFDLLWITMMGILQRPYVRCVCVLTLIYVDAAIPSQMETTMTTNPTTATLADDDDDYDYS